MCATSRRAFSREGSSGVLTVSPFTPVKEYSHAIDEESVKSVIEGRLASVGYARTTRPCRHPTRVHQVLRARESARQFRASQQLRA